jgi:hypothetical protein
MDETVNPFLQSPEYAQAMRDIDALRQREAAERAAYSSLVTPLQERLTLLETRPFADITAQQFLPQAQNLLQSNFRQAIEQYFPGGLDEYNRRITNPTVYGQEFALPDISSVPFAEYDRLYRELLPRTIQRRNQEALDAITQGLRQSYIQEQTPAVQSEIARINEQLAAERGRIVPLVENIYQQTEQAQQNLQNMQRAFAASQFAQQLGTTPEQFIQQQNQQVAQREAEAQAQQQASQALDQQRVNYILQTGVIPTSEEQFPEELRSVNIPQVTAPQVATPVLPQYSFLGQQPVAQPTTQPAATQPVAQPAVAQPVQAAAQTTPPSFLGGIPVGIGGQAQPTGTTPMATTPSLNPATLPELRSAGGGGTSAIDPTLRPYLELGLRAAEQQFLQNQPQFFPGQTYVSPSQQTLDALAAQEQIARQAPATLQAAQESYMRGLGGLGATASGAFLSGNPFQQQMIQAATRPIMQQFEEQTLPGIASGFSGAGRYGSGAMERALGRATESTARAIGDVSTNIAFQDYGAERGRQQQAILGQITAAGQAPAIYGQQFLPGQQLAQIGAAREAIAGLPLQEQMQRFQFAQQAPRESLGAFLSSIYGTPMARSQYAPTPEVQTNRAASAFGLGALGAGIGSMIGGQTGAFGFSTPQLTAGGAALGALGGLLL